MKKIKNFLLIFAALFLIAGCSKKQENPVKNSAEENQGTQEEIALASEIDIPQTDTAESEPDSGKKDEAVESAINEMLKESSERAEEKKNSKVDVDFTKMSQTMIFAQTFNMVLESPKYLGKTVKFQGQVFSSYNEMAKTTLHSIIQYDATACCQTGFEFILPPGSEYPADGSQIEIVGKYSYTDKFTFDYFYLECTDVKMI